MGVDVLDLCFRLKKQFGITLEDVELFYFLNRVSHIEDLVWDHLQGIRPALPIEPKRFSERVSMEILKLPGTRKDPWGFGNLERMIPLEGREENWKQLGENLGLPLPDLKISSSNASLRFPPELQTVGSFVFWVYRNFPDRLPVSRERTIGKPLPQAEKFSREDVSRIVREIISETLVVSLEQVTPEARLIEDLGME